MKRSLFLLAAFALMLSLGCDNAKKPLAPENSTTPQAETTLEKAAATIVVPDDYATIQAAVDAANPGNKIIVKASGSPYNEVVLVTKPDIEITAKGSVTLNGNISVAANNVKISHFNINVLIPPGVGPDAGIGVGAVSGVKIAHNTITGNSRGIILNGSTGCLVQNNVCRTTFPFDGILLYYYANGNTITKNTCTGNSEGINLVFSDNNEVSFNDCSTNRQSGINVGGSNGNKFKNNTCNRNGTGLTVNPNSINNSFGPGNTANFNNAYGIILSSGADNNTVKKNDFHCNTLGDILDLGTGNTFIENSTGPLPGGCP